MNRRGFLGALLAASMAPAVVRAESLMRIVDRHAVRGQNKLICTLDELSYLTPTDKAFFLEPVFGEIRVAAYGAGGGMRIYQSDEYEVNQGVVTFKTPPSGTLIVSVGRQVPLQFKL